MWNLLEGRDLLTRALDDSGKYRPDAHIAEMIALLGPPPKELLVREREGLGWNWAPAIQNDEGKLCTKACEWYGGPFFDENGKSPPFRPPRYYWCHEYALTGNRKFPTPRAHPT